MLYCILVFLPPQMVKLPELDEDGERTWKEGDDRSKLSSAQLKPPQGEVVRKRYKNINDMAMVVGDKNILQSIQNLLGQIPQSFEHVCQTASYPVIGQIPASLIIVFYDYQIYDLKVTLSSIQVNTPESLIREIIVVDDGSTDAKVVKDAKEYVGRIPKAVLIRNDKHEGEVIGRLKAVRKAKSARLVFLSTTVVVAPGWLEPLLDHVHHHTLAVAVPHLDKVFESYKYELVPRTWVAGFFWSLVVKLTRVVQKEENTDILLGVKSPTLKGDIFATTTDYIKQIGFYDASLAGSGAEHIELSLRTWMCRGEIKVIRCSHAGILNFLDSSPIDDAMSAWRVSQLWMSDYVSLTAHLSGLHYNPSADDIDLVNKRKEVLAGKCDKDIKWYLDHVATNVYLPSRNAKTVGLFQVKNGFCCNLVQNKTRLALEVCVPEKVGQTAKEMTFEHTAIGQIKVQGRCLASVNSYVMVEECRPDDTQIWLRKGDGTYRWKADDMCLMHVSDPELKHKGLVMQTLMAQDCSKDQSDMKKFSAFMFIPPG